MIAQNKAIGLFPLPFPVEHDSIMCTQPHPSLVAACGAVSICVATTTAATTIDELPCIASLAGGATLLACQQGSGFDSPWRSRRSDHLF